MSETPMTREEAKALGQALGEAFGEAMGAVINSRLKELEKRVAALEAKLADSQWLWDNAAATLGLPPAPATNPDPTA